MRVWKDGEALYVAEHSALRTALAIGRVLLEAWLDSLRGGHCGPRDTDETGRVRGFKQYVVRTIETVVGTVRVVLAQYYRKGAEPACVCPLARRLGLRSGQYSHGLEELIAMAGAHGAYRESLAWLERLTGARVSVHKAETTMAAWGQEAKAKRPLVAAEVSVEPAPGDPCQVRVLAVLSPRYQLGGITLQAECEFRIPL